MADGWYRIATCRFARVTAAPASCRPRARGAPAPPWRRTPSGSRCNSRSPIPDRIAAPPSCPARSPPAGSSCRSRSAPRCRSRVATPTGRYDRRPRARHRPALAAARPTPRARDRDRPGCRDDSPARTHRPRAPARVGSRHRPAGADRAGPRACRARCPIPGSRDWAGARR